VVAADSEAGRLAPVDGVVDAMAEAPVDGVVDAMLEAEAPVDGVVDAMLEAEAPVLPEAEAETPVLLEAESPGVGVLVITVGGKFPTGQFRTGEKPIREFVLSKTMA